MGFVGVDPHQLAPFVGTTQVGIMISAVPSSANQNSRARTRSSPLKGFKITANISAIPASLTKPHQRQVQHRDNNQVQRRRQRNRRTRRAARNPYEGVPLGEARHAAEDSQTFRQPTTARTPAAHQDDGYESDTSDQQDHRQERRNRRPKRSAREIYSETQLYGPRDAVEQPRVTRRPNTTHVPGGGQDNDSERPVGEYYDPD